MSLMFGFRWYLLVYLRSALCALYGPPSWPSFRDLKHHAPSHCRTFAQALLPAQSTLHNPSHPMG